MFFHHRCPAERSIPGHFCFHMCYILTMRKFHKVVLAVFAALLLIVIGTYVAAINLAPRIVGDKISSVLESSGIGGVVSFDIERIGLRSALARSIVYSLESNEVRLSNVKVDYSSLLSGGSDIAVSAGRLQVDLTDPILDLLVERGVPLSFFKGQGISLELWGIDAIITDEEMFFSVEASSASSGSSTILEIPSIEGSVGGDAIVMYIDGMTADPRAISPMFGVSVPMDVISVGSIDLRGGRDCSGLSISNFDGRGDDICLEASGIDIALRGDEIEGKTGWISVSCPSEGLEANLDELGFFGTTSDIGFSADDGIELGKSGRYFKSGPIRGMIENGVVSLEEIMIEGEGMEVHVPDGTVVNGESLIYVPALRFEDRFYSLELDEIHGVGREGVIVLSSNGGRADISDAISGSFFQAINLADIELGLPFLNDGNAGLSVEASLVSSSPVMDGLGLAFSASFEDGTLKCRDGLLSLIPGESGIPFDFQVRDRTITISVSDSPYVTIDLDNPDPEAVASILLKAAGRLTSGLLRLL